jgi:hypothetical protein
VAFLFLKVPPEKRSDHHLVRLLLALQENAPAVHIFPPEKKLKTKKRTRRKKKLQMRRTKKQRKGQPNDERSTQSPSLLRHLEWRS